MKKSETIIELQNNAAIFGKKHRHVWDRTNDENGCPAKLGMSDGFLLADTDALLSSF